MNIFQKEENFQFLLQKNTVTFHDLKSCLPFGFSSSFIDKHMLTHFCKAVSEEYFCSQADLELSVWLKDNLWTFGPLAFTAH